MSPHRPTIKRGVSLYSFQQEYFLGTMSLEDCIRVSAEFGAPGIEIIGEQMVPGFPRLPDPFVAKWRGWMDRYGTVPVAHDMFLDTRLYKDRVLTDAEALQSIVRDIEFAATLGCSVIRMLVIVPAALMEAAIPYAEKHGIKLLLEVHSPWHFRDEWISGHLEVMQRTRSPWLGLLPDLGIFVKRFPRVIAERAIRDGAPERVVRHIVDAYDAGEDMHGLADAAIKMGGNERAAALARTASHYINLPPGDLIEYMPYIHHIHGKFYDMVDGEEYSIPYPEIIAALHEGGFDGYICSEYEGQRHIQDAFEVDSVAQVRAHQDMLDRLIRQLPGE